MTHINRMLIILYLFLICTSSLTAGEELLGAGATFPYPLYSKMFDVYYKQYGIKVNYQSIGSGGGIKQIINKTVDFGATDSFMTDEELKTAPAEIVHIPTCLGSVAICFNLAGQPNLKLTPEILADIYMGGITRWDDNRIKAANPGLSLPKMPIMVIHRSDGSGTTYIFSDYLSKVSQSWEKRVGRGKALRWLTGLGAKGNEGVAGLIKQIPGSIGYIELAYAIQNKMSRAAIRNAAGNFIEPTLDSTSRSAETEIPPDTRVSITNTSAAEGYAISGFTWIILYKEQKYDSRSREKAQALVNLLWWMTHEGQNYTQPLDYAPLPDSAVGKTEAILRAITFGGTPLLEKP